MLLINALTEAQKNVIKNEYRVHLNSSKSIFDVDYIVDEIFDTCVMNHSIFDLSQDCKSSAKSGPIEVIS